MALTEEEIKEANKKIAEHVKKAYAEIHKAEAIADETGVAFTFDVAYGMGGTYFPPKGKAVEAGETDEGDDWYESGWQSSSSRC